MAFKIFLIFILGIIGAVIAKLVRDQQIYTWSPVITSILSGLLWAWILQDKKVNLSFTSAMFDVVYGGAHIVGFLLLGDRLNPLQMFGFLIALFGVYLMA